MSDLSWTSSFLDHIQLHPSYHYHPRMRELHRRTRYHPSEHVTLQNIFQIFSFKNISTSASISLSSADICTSSSDLNFLQIFSLKIISTSFVASISLSSGDILPSSSYLNFSVVYCTCVLCCLLQNWFVYSLCTAHHLKARPGSSS